MVNAKFCISIDDKGDRHVSVPWKEAQLPHWLLVEKFNPYVTMPISILTVVIDAYKMGNQKLINEILSKYY